MKIDVIFSPGLFPESFNGTLCSVIDVLRATTTIITALASGAGKIYPCTNADEARQQAKGLKDGLYLLGGEEKGQRITGFHLGNSPFEYLKLDYIKDKVILFSTSNGTPVIKKAYSGSGLPVYLLALTNLSAASSAIVKSALEQSLDEIFIVCSGSAGKPSLEDSFCAGLAVRETRQNLIRSGVNPALGDCATIALQFAIKNAKNSSAMLAESRHGRALQRIGFADDIEFASRIDKYKIAPVFNGTAIVTDAELT